jgi:hypothetical protein
VHVDNHHHLILKNDTYKYGYVFCSKYFGVKLKLVYFDNCKFYGIILWISLKK